MKTPSFVGTVLALAMLAFGPTGCAIPELAPGESLPPNAPQGVAVLSITHSGQRGFDLIVQLSGPGTGLRRALRLPRWSDKREWNGAPGTDPTPESNPQGNLFVLRLDPGTYQLWYWSGESELGGAYGLGFEIHGDPIAVDFHVTAGASTYAGNLHLALPEKINYWASSASATYRLDVTDRGERDLAALKRRNPKISAVGTNLATSPQSGKSLRYYVVNRSENDGPLRRFRR